MFYFAHCAMLLAPTEVAFDHRPARLRHAIALAARGPFVDGAPAALASFGDAVVLLTCGVTMRARGLAT
jgi:hypothetical protein